MANSHGEYLLSLTCDFQPGEPVDQLEFDLVVPDDDVTTAKQDGHLSGVSSGGKLPSRPLTFHSKYLLFSPGDRPLRRHQLRTMEVSIQTAEKALNAELTANLRPLTGKRIFWEIYCGGSSRTAEMAETYGMQVERFGLDNGWDF